jgi:hypothetical protein
MPRTPTRLELDRRQGAMWKGPPVGTILYLLMGECVRLLILLRVGIIYVLWLWVKLTEIIASCESRNTQQRGTTN